MIVMFLVSVMLISMMAPSVYAANKSEVVSGGWSDSKGYYITNAKGTRTMYKSGAKGFTTSVNATNAAGTPTKTPNRHTGKRLIKAINSAGDKAYAAYGETVWYYKWHYTTARMELTNGTVKTTSGRRIMENASHAQSPYYTPKTFENTEARTYWGGVK